MSKDSGVKKVSRKFISLADEERWLHDMLNEGWRLQSYDSEDMDTCQYRFEPAAEAERSGLVYRIDYRTFERKAEYEEYRELFAEAGWTLLSSNKRYAKHIFYTTDPEAGTSIFSDTESLKARDKRKLKSYLVNLGVSAVLFALCVGLYLVFKRTSILGAGILTLLSSLKFAGDYWKQRKAYKATYMS